MKTLPALLLLGLAAVMPAAGADFDTANCKTYLTGAWDGGGSITLPNEPTTIVGTATWHTVFGADGTYTSETIRHAEGNPNAETETARGAWDATAGDKPSTCAVKLSPEGASAWTQTFTITGPDEMTDESGNSAKRVK